MVLLASFVLPHGSIILEPSRDSLPDSCATLHAALKKVGQAVEDMKPELIVLVTPHGLALSESFALYSNESVKGTAEWEGLYSEFGVEAQIDTTATAHLHSHLKQRHIRVDTITSFATSLATPLRWGEAVPLWFLRASLKASKVVILSVPSKRHDHAVSMIPELLSLGKALGEFLHEQQQRCVLVVSGDLAHTHAHTIRNQPTPYTPSDTAAAFDKAIQLWAEFLDARILTEDAASLLGTARSCGFTGFVALQGVVDYLRSQGEKIMGSILAREAPTYYGMMVAVFM